MFQLSRQVAGSRQVFAEQIASPSGGPPAPGSLEDTGKVWQTDHARAPPRPQPTPLTDVIDRATLLALLTTLPPRRRAVLVLRFFEDLSVEQTAEALGCAVGTVKAHTHQGLAGLRALLGGQPRLIAQLKEDQ